MPPGPFGPRPVSQAFEQHGRPPHGKGPQEQRQGRGTMGYHGLVPYVALLPRGEGTVTGASLYWTLFVKHFQEKATEKANHFDGVLHLTTICNFYLCPALLFDLPELRNWLVHLWCCFMPPHASPSLSARVLPMHMFSQSD